MGLSVGQHHDLLSRATAQGMSDEDTIVFNKTYRALTALHKSVPPPHYSHGSYSRLVAGSKLL